MYKNANFHTLSLNRDEFKDTTWRTNILKFIINFHKICVSKYNKNVKNSLTAYF